MTDSLPLLLEFAERHLVFVTIWIIALVFPFCCRPFTLSTPVKQVFEKHIHRGAEDVDVERESDES